MLRAAIDRLRHLRDVASADPSDGDALVWDADAGKWKPGEAAGSGGADPATFPRYVVHGDDADAERPTGDGLVVWVGTVQPNNAITTDDAWDVWIDPNGNGTTPAAPETHRLVVLHDTGDGLEPLADDDGRWLYGAYPGLEHV